MLRQKCETFVEKKDLQTGFECSGGDQNADLRHGAVAVVVGHAPTLLRQPAPNYIEASMRGAIRGVNLEKSGSSFDRYGR